jgi:hypothetical protein
MNIGKVAKKALNIPSNNIHEQHFHVVKNEKCSKLFPPTNKSHKLKGRNFGARVDLTFIAI